MKLIKWIASFFPVSKKEYEKDIKALYTIVKALTQAESQHAQIEMNLLKNIGLLTTDKLKTEKLSTESEDISYA